MKKSMLFACIIGIIHVQNYGMLFVGSIGIPVRFFSIENSILFTEKRSRPMTFVEEIKNGIHNVINIIDKYREYETGERDNFLRILTGIENAYGHNNNNTNEEFTVVCNKDSDYVEILFLISQCNEKELSELVNEDGCVNVVLQNLSGGVRLRFFGKKLNESKDKVKKEDQT